MLCCLPMTSHGRQPACHSRAGRLLIGTICLKGEFDDKSIIVVTGLARVATMLPFPTVSQTEDSCRLVELISGICFLR